MLAQMGWAYFDVCLCKLYLILNQCVYWLLHLFWTGASLEQYVYSLLHIFLTGTSV